MRKLVIAAVLAAGLAAGLLPRPSAAADALVEGESMSLSSAYGAVFADAKASGGKARLIWTNAAATKAVTAPAITKVVVRAKGDQCGGAPRLTLKVDGVSVLTTSVSATSWTDYGVSLVKGAGTRSIAVAFTNDYRTSLCDRNLRVDVVKLVAAPAPTPTPTPSPAATPTPAPSTSRVLYVDPYSQAKAQADAWRASRPSDAALLDTIAGQAQGFWLGSWSGDVRATVDRVLTAAAGRVPVLVAYNIPQRDCGSYSAGGTTPDGYRTWIRSLATGIAGRPSIVVLEPDALALSDCLSSTGRALRDDLLRDAVTVLKAQPGTSVYIDAGHSRWLAAAEAAARLTNAGVAAADGFSLNVSNFGTTSGEVLYGNQIAAALGGKRFVVDTSRNGLGPHPAGEWCNPDGRALGPKPTLSTGLPLVDAYLWVKRPGESDGTCNGGPSAGAFWAEYALGLAQRAAS